MLGAVSHRVQIQRCPKALTIVENQDLYFPPLMTYLFVQIRANLFWSDPFLFLPSGVPTTEEPTEAPTAPVECPDNFELR